MLMIFLLRLANTSSIRAYEVVLYGKNIYTDFVFFIYSIANLLRWIGQLFNRISILLSSLCLYASIY